MNKLISNAEIVSLAKDFDLHPARVKAVLMVESSNSGFDQKGRLKIQFEPLEFHRRLVKNKIPHNFSILTDGNYHISTKDITVVNGVGTQDPEYIAFEAAKTIHMESALLSTSYGLFQIMGYNFLTAGFPSVQAMYHDFCLSEFFQVKGGLNFIRANRVMYVALKNGDFPLFSDKFNGPDYKKFKYDTRLEAAEKTAMKLYGQSV